MKIKKIVFLDRDGTIIKDYNDEEWCMIDEIEILEGALEGLNLLARMGYEFIIITNQYLIGDGYINIDQYNNINNQVKKLFVDNNLSLLDVFYCPHASTEPCDCRKPKNYFFTKASSLYNFDISTSFMIGDSDDDYGFACNSNITFFGIRSNNLTKVDGYNNILEISKIILNSSDIT